MGDIIKPYKAKSTSKEHWRVLRFCHDNGSPRTFVRFNAVHGMKALASLPENAVFHGMGNGAFRATHTIRLYIQLKGIWVDHLCYVVPDIFFEDAYDVLLGHDFMQIYDIRLIPRQRRAIINEASLKLALRVR